MTSQGNSPSFATPKKKQRNDNKLGRLAVIYTVSIYKLYKHTKNSNQHHWCGSFWSGAYPNVVYLIAPFLFTFAFVRGC